MNAEEQIQNLSSTTELQSFTNTIEELRNAVESIETSMTDWGLDLPDVANNHTQTEGLTLRELQGLDKALQNIRGELTNNLAKLNDIDKDIAKNKKKKNKKKKKKKKNVNYKKLKMKSAKVI